MYSILIKGGIVVDGSGKTKPLVLDIGIKDDKIVELGSKLNSVAAKEVIDAYGLYVFPGFIDIHSHADINLLKMESTPKIFQGVTTEIVGNCGFSFYPIDEETKLIDWMRKNKAIWGEIKLSRSILNSARTIEDYYTYSQGRLCSNLVSLIGYGTVRYNVAGYKNKITAEEIKKIKYIIEYSLDHGAHGVSFGLVYLPCSFATSDEILEITKTVAKKGKIIACHLRDEADDVIKAVFEIIEISKKANANLQISHYKVYGSQNWSKVDFLLTLIERVNRDISVNFDLYPYTSGSTTLAAIPDNIKMYSSIGFKNILLSSYKKSIAELSKKDTISTINKILKTKPDESVIIFGLSNSVVEKLIKSKYHIFGSDGLYGKNPHPRTYGTYPRILSEYVKNKRFLSLQEAIHKMTYKAAQKLNIEQRGLIKKNYFADLVIIDMKKIKDRATYDAPLRKPSGIEYVIVNGKIAVSQGLFKYTFAGEIL